MSTDKQIPEANRQPGDPTSDDKVKSELTDNELNETSAGSGPGTVDGGTTTIRGIIIAPKIGPKL